VYVHVLDWPDDVLAIPDLPTRVTNARMLDTGAPIRFRQSEEGVTLFLPGVGDDGIDRVAVLEVGR